MNYQAILEQLARNPKSRAVQLADRLDQPLEDVQAQLVALIAVGEVVSEPGVSPAQHPCQVYSLTREFAESEKGARIVAKAEILVFRDQHKTLGTAALATAFIEKRGSATSTELSVLLGLEQNQYPSVVLSSSVQNERLAVSGRTWRLGPKAIPGTRGRDAQESCGEPGLNGKAELPIPVFAPTAAPTAAPTSMLTAAPTCAPSSPSTTALSFAPTTAPAATGRPRFRFAIWSDGQVEIQRNGVPLAALPRDVAAEFADFVRGAAC